MLRSLYIVYQLYGVKYLVHCITSRGIGVEFCWVPSRCGLCWNETSDKLAKQGAVENMSTVACNSLLLSRHETYSILEKAVCKPVTSEWSCIDYDNP